MSSKSSSVVVPKEQVVEKTEGEELLNWSILWLVFFEIKTLVHCIVAAIPMLIAVGVSIILRYIIEKGVTGVASLQLIFVNTDYCSAVDWNQYFWGFDIALMEYFVWQSYNFVILSYAVSVKLKNRYSLFKYRTIVGSFIWIIYFFLIFQNLIPRHITWLVSPSINYLAHTIPSLVKFVPKRKSKLRKTLQILVTDLSALVADYIFPFVIVGAKYLQTPLQEVLVLGFASHFILIAIRTTLNYQRRKFTKRASSVDQVKLFRMQEVSTEIVMLGPGYVATYLIASDNSFFFTITVGKVLETIGMICFIFLFLKSKQEGNEQAREYVSTLVRSRVVGEKMTIMVSFFFSCIHTNHSLETLLYRFSFILFVELLDDIVKSRYCESIGINFKYTNPVSFPQLCFISANSSMFWNYSSLAFAYQCYLKQ